MPSKPEVDKYKRNTLKYIAVRILKNKYNTHILKSEKRNTFSK